MQKFKPALIALLSACLLADALLLPMGYAQSQSAGTVEFFDPQVMDPQVANSPGADPLSTSVNTKVMQFSIPEGQGKSPSTLTVVSSTAPQTDDLVQAALLGTQLPANSESRAQTFVSGDNHTFAVAADVGKSNPGIAPPIFVTFEKMNQPGRVSRTVKAAVHEIRSDKLTFLFFVYRMQNNYFSWIHTAQSNKLGEGTVDVLLAFTSLMLFLRYNQVSSTRLVDTVAARVRTVGRKLRIIRTAKAPDPSQGDGIDTEEVSYPSATTIQRDGARVFASIGISLFQQFLTKGLSSTTSIWNFEMVRDICILILFSNFANYGYTKAFERWNSLWPRGSVNEKDRPMSHNSVNRFNQIKISLQSHISPEASFLDPHEHWILSSYKLARIGFGVLGLAFLKWGETLISWMKGRSAYQLTQRAKATLYTQVDRGFEKASLGYASVKAGLRNLSDRVQNPIRTSPFCPLLLGSSVSEVVSE